MLEEFLGKKEIHALLSKDFVEVMISEDKMPGGKETSNALRKGIRGGVSWFVFLNPEEAVLKEIDGTWKRRKASVLATADGPDGNVGCPMIPVERNHFLECLRTARIQLTDAEIDRIGLILHKFAIETIGEEAGPLPDLIAEVVSSADLLIQFQADKEALGRLWSMPLSFRKAEVMRSFHQKWLALVKSAKNSAVDRAEAIDLALLENHLRHQMKEAQHSLKKDREILPLMEFSNPLVKLCEDHALRQELDSRLAAETLNSALENLTKNKEEEREITPVLARRLAARLNSLRSSLGTWYRFRAEYDPLFTWWCKKPWDALSEALTDYAKFVQKDWGGIDLEDKDLLIGDPIGRQALIDGLEYEMVPYTPEELISIAEREFDWCEKEMQRAMVDLQCDSWKDALNLVKKRHVEPGEQPKMIRELADEAVNFLEERNLLTIPALAKDVWRMGMMSPARQKVSPYFTGGEVISISYPTAGMDHEDKIMSMRGNNRHFSRATVHHELIPGHHLQGYMAKRWNTQRRQFYTPFLVEGWALYWELKLWDLDFQQSAEDRVGMLFWRSHRCARILFSLNFHLGNWSPQECVDFLVKRVGHERNNAEAEIRRSIQGGYGPLYQAAYMLGGLQLRALHKEMVLNGTMSEREFHDAVLKQNSIPVAAIRAALGGSEVDDKMGLWRFDG